MQKVRPLKRFGQNYLVDENILGKIADEINPSDNDFILEIGPGLGALTKHIFERAKKFSVVEIDSRVVEELSNKFPGIEVIHKDVLDLDLQKIAERKNSKLRVVGNIPYNITSQILFKMIDNLDVIEDAVLMMQFEVAQRLNARQGTKDYGILAVIMQLFADINICFKVSPNVFYPKPKVNSAVVHIYFKDTRLSKEEKKFYIQTVKAAFGNRRKTLKNSLSNSIFGNLNFKDSNIDLSLRAEQLSINEFILLAKFVQNNFTQSK